MNFNEKMKAHVGGLIKFTTEVFCHKDKKWKDLAEVCILHSIVDKAKHGLPENGEFCEWGTPDDDEHPRVYAYVLSENNLIFIEINERYVELI